MESVIKTDKKPILFGKVGEVTEQDERVLVPQLPLGHPKTPDFLRTVIYDLLELGYKKEEINDLYGNTIKNSDMWSPTTVRVNTRERGRTVIDLEESPEVGKPKFVNKAADLSGI